MDKPATAPDSKNDALNRTFLRLREKIEKRDSTLQLKEAPHKLAGKSSTPSLSEPEIPCQEEECCIISMPDGTQKFSICEVCNPRLTCTICHGMGRVSNMNPQTLTEEISRAGCSCTLKEKRVLHLNQAALPSRYLDAAFNLPQLLPDQPEIKKLFNAVLNQCEEFTKKAQLVLQNGIEPGDCFFLLLYGPVGCGKTYLAAAILKKILMLTQASGRFIEFQQLLFSLRNCYSEGRSEEEILGPLRTTDILVIDELGKARTENEWQMERLDDLINYRYNAGRITILTTNFAPLHANQYNALSYGLRNPPASEGFWTQTLADRVGLRIYDRVMEVAQVVSFDGLPSLRRIVSQRARQAAHNTKPLEFGPG